jgi:transcriptional regulator GlxA family with amidase domain
VDRTEQGKATVVAQHHQRRTAVAGATNEIGIVVYPGVQAACVHGLTDLFEIAANIACDQQRDGRFPLRVTHWQPAHSRDTELSSVYDSDPRGNPQPRILIIPPTMVDLPDPGIPAGVVSWLRSRYACGAKLVSVCSGAFILAETGLVAGRSVSTHRICADALAKRFPEITVDTNQRIIDDGDIITAGGFLAWVDVGLLLVDRILGAAVRAETARFIHSDPAASAAHYFPGFAPRQTHGDTAVLKAQEREGARPGNVIIGKADRRRSFPLTELSPGEVVEGAQGVGDAPMRHNASGVGLERLLKAFDPFLMVEAKAPIQSEIEPALQSGAAPRLEGFWRFLRPPQPPQV